MARARKTPDAEPAPVEEAPAQLDWVVLAPGPTLIGHYATQEEAEAEWRKGKARWIEGPKQD